MQKLKWNVFGQMKTLDQIKTEHLFYLGGLILFLYLLNTIYILNENIISKERQILKIILKMLRVPTPPTPYHFHLLLILFFGQNNSLDSTWIQK